MAGVFDDIQVECYAGYRGEQTPRRFFVGSRALEVTEVLDAWIGPSYRYFKVRASDAGIYILRHDSSTGHWELTLFDSGSYPPTRLSST